MKKILALLLAALLIFCMVACTNDKEDATDEEDEVIAQDVSTTTTVGTFSYAPNDEGDYEITAFVPATLDLVDVTLPKATEDGRDIVGVADNAFKTKLTIKSITIPETFTYVGDYAFYGCENLEKVTMNNSLTSMGVGAFQNCVKLAEVTLSKLVSVISKDAFSGCSALKTVDLSGAVRVEIGAFFGCAELTSVSFSNAIQYVSSYAFTSTDKLAYTVENGAKYLGNQTNPYLVLVAAENLNIESCTVNDNTTVIADRAFAYCSYLDTVVLGSKVTGINGTCFENDPAYDKLFDENKEIPQVNLSYNNYEGGLYLGTATNPHMVLISVDKPAAVEDFKLAAGVMIITDSAFEKCVNLEDISYPGSSEAWASVIKSSNWTHDLTINVICAD